MTAAVNRVNRAVLTLLGLLLSATGATGLALSFGAFGVQSSRRQLLQHHVSQYASSTPWFWWAAAGGCVVISLLALAWLLAQGRSERIRSLDLTAQDSQGSTVVHAGAVTDAVEQEVSAFLGVTSTSAHLRGTAAPRIDLVVTLDQTADLTDLRHHLQQQTIANIRQALDTPRLPVHIQLHPAPGGRARIQ